MKYFYYIICLILITACVPIQSNYTSSTSTAPVLQLVDKIYSPDIKTVQLYPNNGNTLNQIQAPVIPISKNNLVLEFDDLVENTETYRAKIYNCTHNWQKSKLSAIEYLYDYNEFDVFEYEYSLDTDFPYVHYRFNVPKVKVPGNYVIVVYNSNDENDILLSKRFMVFDTRVDVVPAENINSLSNLTRKNQRIEFFIRYKNYQIENPRESIKVLIQQNNRWDNALQGLQAAYVREDISELEYRFFNNSDFMKGGNEFRFFDFRSIKYPGYRVHTMSRDNGKITVEVVKDKLRANLAYTQYQDKNGKFYIHNQDFNNSASTSNYALVNFSLSGKKIPSNSEIYLFGALTNYELTPNYLLNYKSDINEYALEIMLKQGHYDYQYYNKSDSANYNYIEGDYFETENDYEILVYHRPFGSKTDLLIGYKKL